MNAFAIKMEDPEDYYELSSKNADEKFLEELEKGEDIDSVEKKYKNLTQKNRKEYEKLVNKKLEEKEKKKKKKKEKEKKKV